MKKYLPVAFLAAAAALPASADVLVQQAPDINAGFCSSCGNGDYRAFATFTLAQDSVLQTAKFTGDAFRATGNTVSVWTADRSQQLYSLSYTSADEFNISVSLPDWALAAGDYLFSAYNADGFIWDGHNGAGDDIQVDSEGGVYNFREFNLELDGGPAAVPEPAMLGLFGLGALGLGLARHRKA